MNDIKSIIERMKQAYNVKTNKELAEKLGTSLSNIDNWKKRNNIPDKYLLLTSQMNGVEYNWLLTGEGEMYKTQKGGINVAEKLENAVEINYLPEVYAAAGYGAVNEDYPIIEKMSCSLEFVSSILNIKNPYNGVDIIKVIGDSMEPFISNGEVVVIEKTHNAHNGDIVIANINGNVYVKRLEKDPFGKWVKLISENPEYETIKLEGEELNYMQIVGIVRSKIRPF